MAITSKDLLDQLADLQLILEGYSFEKLNVEEARVLKSYFDTFRNHLEAKIWNPKAPLPKRPVDSGKPNPPDAHGMITAVSHDLRNPLSGILGFADLLADTELSPVQQKYLRAIRLASRSSLDIVDELLQYNRLRSGAERGPDTVFNPVTILGEVREYMQALLEQNPVKFELYVAGSLPEALVGDPSKLRRILMNLLENAVKYTGRGTIEMEVRSFHEKDTPILEFEISDTGKGISRGELPFIFKPYYQAGIPREGTGHGLGLSIVRKLIEEQKGRIEVESQEGRGTTFRFRLPYTRPETGGQHPRPEKPGSSSKEQLKGKRILVFEDNPVNQKLLETRLQSWGCTVHTATKVPDGLRILGNKPVDLVLMDLRMPLMHGFEAARRIRQHRDDRVRSIPIIALTADVGSAGGEHYRESGMDDLLLKPYSPDILYAAIAYWTGTNADRKEPRPFQRDVLSNLKSDDCPVSLDYLEAECMGDSRMLSDLVQLFRNNLLEFAGRMKFYLKEEDQPAILDSTHKVMSGIKLIGASRLLETVKEIHEAVTGAMDMPRAARAYQEFLKCYPQVEEALEREMNKRR